MLVYHLEGVWSGMEMEWHGNEWHGNGMAWKWNGMEMEWHGNENVMGM